MRRVALVVVSMLLGCGGGQSAPEPRVEDLPTGIVARVGTDDISTSEVALVSGGGRVTPREALDRIIVDALFAAGARSRWAGTGRVAAAERAGTGRALLEKLAADARAAGPPTDSEVARVTERRWWELDRPPTARVTHAVVRVKKPEEDERAKKLAERIAKATHGADSAAEFEKRVGSVDDDGLTVLVEHLSPVTQDGRVVPGQPPPPGTEPGRFEESFARAALALDKPGDQSGPVKSGYGYHVIYLEERLPAQRMPLEERRKAVAEEVMADRARAVESSVIEAQAKQHPVVIDRAAASLTGKVRIGR
jgi:peptidyl-prolyl cis-trans isomerase C